MEESPASYSTIFWHFTGAPKFKNNAKIIQPYDMTDPGKIKKEKTDQEAVEILKKILIEKKLLATSKEKIIKGMEAKYFCCVSDMPLDDLETHAKYYGNVGIGFSARAIYRDFNPVLYINHERLELVMGLRKRIERRTKNRATRSTGPEEKKQDLSLDRLKNYIKITNFNEATRKTFYREREWRCLKDFEFDIKDVSGIIIPKRYIQEMNSFLSREEYNNVSILSWEIIRKS